MLGSQGVVLATAMVVSSTVLFLAFSKDKTLFSPQVSKNLDSHQSTTQALRSCLSSEEKKREKKKKKRVKFAENVKDTKGNGEEYRREKESSFFSRREEERKNSCPNLDRICRNEIPANRIALYNGILRDRVHRTQCSY
ncbi:uncharacterized protein LOC8282327 [Ricinus communis]|uniref:Uncharacterized protein n=1 Tax=Ricinus communis TaxID=3988 RepID=B9RV57_RICCO|nr:uncharacterized protein LOC8282327 [Ricinus communis]EEF44790.1 conserved hypothetical protein [Ricinus communis]|eukprot:XP_002517626.1 uncharacterized protein LOC8282327 [Ricinus communis]